MTTYPAVVSRTAGPYHATVTWTLTGTGTGLPVAMPGYRLRSITIKGTFNSGTVTVLGGNDDAQAETAVGIKDRSGSAISTAAAAFYGLPDAPQWLYPSATAATSIIVTAYYERSIGA